MGGFSYGTDGVQMGLTVDDTSQALVFLRIATCLLAYLVEYQNNLVDISDWHVEKVVERECCALGFLTNHKDTR